MILEAMAAGNVRPASVDGWRRQGMSRPAAPRVRIPKDGGREWPVLQRRGFESWGVTAGNVPSCRTLGSNSAIRRSGRPYLCAEASQPHIAFSGRPATQLSVS